MMNDRVQERAGLSDLSTSQRVRAPAHLERGSQRDTMLLLSTLRMDDGTIRTLRIRNLSSGGLMAEADAGITEDMPVQVDLRTIGWVRARVAWVQDDRIGLKFAKPIDPAAARQRARPAPDGMKLIIPISRTSNRPPLKVR